MGGTTSWTGLAAESWDCLGGDQVLPDEAYFRAMIEEGGGPALDVGCGSGRLLVGYLRAGLEVHGIDTSADMLALCRAKASRSGVEARLYQQAMEALELPTRYATIFVPCGSFMLLTEDSSALAALRGFREHLAPGGRLALTFFGPYAPPRPSLGEWQRRSTGSLPNGAEVSMDIITDTYDQATRVVESRRKYTLRREGEVEREELLIDRYRWYDVERATGLLERAGFDDWTVTGDFSDQPLAEGHGMMVLRAER